MAPFNHHSTEGLFIPTANPCNDYLVQFLIHSKIIMDKQAIRLQYTYQLAVESVRKYPLPVVCREQLKILEGFGRFLINQIDQLVKRHYQRGRLETEEEMNAELEWHVKNVTEHAKRLEKKIYVKRVTEKKFKKYQKLNKSKGKDTKGFEEEEQVSQVNQSKSKTKNKGKLKAVKANKKFTEESDGQESCQSSLNLSGEENEEELQGQGSEDSCLFSDEDGKPPKRNSEVLNFPQSYECQLKPILPFKKQKKSCFKDSSSQSSGSVDQNDEIYNIENHLEVELGGRRGKGKPLRTPMFNTEPYQVIKAIYLLGGPSRNVVSKFKINEVLFDTINTRIANWKILKIRLLEAGYIIFPRMNDMYDIILTQKGSQLVETTDEVLRKYGILKRDEQLSNKKGSSLEGLIQEQIKKKLKQKEIEEQYLKEMPETAQFQQVKLIVTQNERYLSLEDQKTIVKEMRNIKIVNVRNLVKQVKKKQPSKDATSKNSNQASQIFAQKISQLQKLNNKKDINQGQNSVLPSESNELAINIQSSSTKRKCKGNSDKNANKSATKNRSTSKNTSKVEQESISVQQSSNNIRQNCDKKYPQLPTPTKMATRSRNKKKIDIANDCNEQKNNQNQQRREAQNKQQLNELKKCEQSEYIEYISKKEEEQEQEKDQQIQQTPSQFVKIIVENKFLEVGTFMWSVSGMLIDCLVVRFRARDFDVNQWSLVLQQAKTTRCTRLFIWVHLEGLEKMSEKRRRRLIRFLIFARLEKSMKIRVIETKEGKGPKITEFLRLMTEKIEAQVGQHFTYKRWVAKMAEEAGACDSKISCKSSSVANRQLDFTEFWKQKLEESQNQLSNINQKSNFQQNQQANSSQQQQYLGPQNGLGTIAQFNQRLQIQNPYSLKRVTTRIWEMLEDYGCDSKIMTDKMSSVAFIFEKLSELDSMEEKVEFLKWLFRRTGLKKGIVMVIVDLLFLKSYDQEPCISESFKPESSEIVLESSSLAAVGNSIQEEEE